MAHIDRMLGNISDFDQRQRVAKMMSQPLPKLGFIEIPAYEIDNYSRMSPLPDQENPRWETVGDGHAPTTCRMINLSSLADPSQPQKDIEEIGIQAADRLRWRGCNAIVYMHAYPDPETPGEKKKEVCLAIPCMRLEMEEGKPSPIRDIKGSGQWLAFLMDEKWATEKDLSDTFGENFIAEAQKHRQSPPDNPGPARGR